MITITHSPVAGGTSTLSKSSSLFPLNSPKHLIRAKGSQVWADDGRVLTDWISGLLAVTLGHNHPEVTEAVTKHLQDGGPTWSLPHLLESEVAETILRLTGFEGGQVRFLREGSSACSAAIRIARAVTGRNVVLSSGYHGWHDGLLAAAPAWGIPDYPRGKIGKPGHPIREGLVLRTFESHNLDAASYYFWGLSPEDDGQYGTEDPAGRHLPACVIIEPVTSEEPPPGYLEGLRKLCDEYGALLIADECISAFRYQEGTAMQHYGVRPDLLVTSKPLANGWPLACVVGQREIMRCFDLGWSPDWDTSGASGPIYASGTYSAASDSFAAAKATLRIWEEQDVAFQVATLGEMLQESLRAVTAEMGLQDRVRIKGVPYRIILDIPSLVDRTAILSRMIDAGHLCGAGFNPTFAHTMTDVVRATDSFVLALRKIDEPAGRPVVAPYRQA